MPHFKFMDIMLHSSSSETCYPKDMCPWSYFSSPDSCVPESREPALKCDYMAKHRWPKGRDELEYQVFSRNWRRWMAVGWLDEMVCSMYV